MDANRPSIPPILYQGMPVHPGQVLANRPVQLVRETQGILVSIHPPTEGPHGPGDDVRFAWANCYPFGIMFVHHLFREMRKRINEMRCLIPPQGWGMGAVEWWEVHQSLVSIVA